MREFNRLQLALLICVFCVASIATEAQIRFRVAGGLSTDWITNDNPAVYRITGSGDYTDTTLPFGGGFDGMQMGWGLKGFADLDKQKRLRIPIGIDYFMFRGAQTITAPNSVTNVTHSTDLLTGILGFEWSFVEFPLAYARGFIGAEARFVHVFPNELHTKVVNFDQVLVDVTASHKPAADRLGFMGRLGIEGELYYPVFINTSVAWGVMNLIGRDMRPTNEGGRGELLTSVRKFESGESLVFHLNYTFMIQVRL